MINKCKFLALALALSVSCHVSANQTYIDLNENGFNAGGAVIDDYVLYNIGGGRAVAMSRSGNMQSIAVGAGWNSNLICGDMSINTTIKNQLNGVTNGFQQIMSTVIQNATSAVASLPALIIQRANPALYNLLTNGILQARVDFDRSKLTCRAISGKMADIAGGQASWDQLAEGMALKSAIGSQDAVAAIEKAESSKGNGGVPWVGGENAGGAGQQPIRVVSGVTQAGYNLLNGRSATSTSSISAESCNGNMICHTWRSPEEAAQFAVRVLGEQEQRTCEDCIKTQTTAGVGLTPLIQEEFDIKLTALSELISNNQPMTFENLEAASSNSIPITRGVIEALREEPDLDLLAKRLASEVALSSVIEKALLLQRTMLTGSKEPNIAANELAQSAVSSEMHVLAQEISNLKTELELRQNLANNSAASIIERSRLRAESSRGIYVSDPDKNRFDSVSKPVAGDE